MRRRYALRSRSLIRKGVTTDDWRLAAGGWRLAAGGLQSTVYLDAAVEPVDFPRVVGVAAPRQLVAQRARAAVGVDVVAEEARGEHYARGAVHALRLVGEERALVVVARRGDLLGEHHRVLDRHVRALREVLERRMRGVAQQRRAARSEEHTS